MHRALAKCLVRLYPRAWRERYGAEFEMFLATGPGGFSSLLNVMRSALVEHVFPTRGGSMETNSFGSVLRRPSAFLPMTMSLAALAVVLIHIALFGVARQPDEGTAAHLWQLLMAGQLPVLLYFAIRWLPKAPRASLGVLAMQAGAALASLAPVFFLHL